jgi:hypothetical protein
MAWRHRRSDERLPPPINGARFSNMPWSARELVPSLVGWDADMHPVKRRFFRSRSMTRVGERFSLISHI